VLEYASKSGRLKSSGVTLTMKVGVWSLKDTTHINMDAILAMNIPSSEKIFWVVLLEWLMVLLIWELTTRNKNENYGHMASRPLPL